jgi:hypothetical protein
MNPAPPESNGYHKKGGAEVNPVRHFSFGGEVSTVINIISLRCFLGGERACLTG